MNIECDVVHEGQVDDLEIRLYRIRLLGQRVLKQCKEDGYRVVFFNEILSKPVTIVAEVCKQVNIRLEVVPSLKVVDLSAVIVELLQGAPIWRLLFDIRGNEHLTVGDLEPKLNVLEFTLKYCGQNMILITRYGSIFAYTYRTEDLWVLFVGVLHHIFDHSIDQVLCDKFIDRLIVVV